MTHPFFADIAPIKFEGAEAVFERLDNEMSRQAGNIAVISAPLQGEKLKDLRQRRATAALATHARGRAQGAQGAQGRAHPDNSMRMVASASGSRTITPDATAQS